MPKETTIRDVTTAESCSFCTKTKREVSALVACAHPGIHICNECVGLAIVALAEQKKEPKLRRLKAVLNRHVGYPEDAPIAADDEHGDCDFELLESAREDFADELADTIASYEIMRDSYNSTRERLRVVVKERDEQRARAERSEAAHIASIEIGRLTRRVAELEAKLLSTGELT